MRGSARHLFDNPMTQLLSIHPDTPQLRLLAKAGEVVRQGGVIAYPTDSGYALGCHLDDKAAVDKIRRIRQLDSKHNFTLMCRDLSELATYAKVDNVAYRLLKSHTPGAYTFILNATNEVPRRLKHAKRKTIGLRVPDNAIAQGLLAELGEPMMSVTLIMPGQDQPLLDAWEIKQELGSQLDLIVDGGYCGMEPTTVVDLTHETPELIRIGAGSTEGLE